MWALTKHLFKKIGFWFLMLAAFGALVGGCHHDSAAGSIKSTPCEPLCYNIGRSSTKGELNGRVR